MYLILLKNLLKSKSTMKAQSNHILQSKKFFGYLTSNTSMQEEKNAPGVLL